jgi:hypothetical protein
VVKIGSFGLKNCDLRTKTRQNGALNQSMSTASYVAVQHFSGYCQITKHPAGDNAMQTKPNSKNSKTIKTAIHNASTKVQGTVVKTETAAVAAVERVEDAMASVKTNFDGVKAFSTNVMDVVDNAGRTVVGGAVTLQSSLVNFGKDVVNDTIEVGRKSFESKSVSDAVTLQAAFAERRINALFHTVAAVNAINHNNVIAMWGPLVSMVTTLSEKTGADKTGADKADLSAVGEMAKAS